MVAPASSTLLALVGVSFADLQRGGFEGRVLYLALDSSIDFISSLNAKTGQWEGIVPAVMDKLSANMGMRLEIIDSKDCRTELMTGGWVVHVWISKL